MKFDLLDRHLSPVFAIHENRMIVHKMGNRRIFQVVILLEMSKYHFTSNLKLTNNYQTFIMSFFWA